MNPPKAERAKPSLSSDYNLLFKNKIGERSLDIHRSVKPTAQSNWSFEVGIKGYAGDREGASGNLMVRKAF